ncbi:hypothetical protein LTR28_003485 [Elasticomyces elasticus]|nr:hypothetical protein LTR28_003485 [Elasticomyces elasticus]
MALCLQSSGYLVRLGAYNGQSFKEGVSLTVYDELARWEKYAYDCSELERVDFDKWIFFLVSTLGPMMGQLNWFRHYNATKNKDALARYEAQTYRTYDVLEGQLKGVGGEYILGGRECSAVDLHFDSWVYQHAFAQLSLDKEPEIQKWLKRMGEMKEVKAAYEKVPKGQEM